MCREMENWTSKDQFFAGLAAGRALSKLDEIGSWVDIAMHLQEEGVKGVPMDCACCPVARYVQKAIGDEMGVDPRGAVCEFDGDSHVTVTFVGSGGSPGQVDAQASGRELRKFADRFDEGKIPSLIEGEG